MAIYPLFATFTVGASGLRRVDGAGDNAEVGRTFEQAPTLLPRPALLSFMVQPSSAAINSSDLILPCSIPSVYVLSHNAGMGGFDEESNCYVLADLDWVY
jgi:hypothetical protein